MKKLFAFLLLAFLISSHSFGRTPEYTQVYYDASNNSMRVWVRHRTLDGENHRISKYEILYDGLKFELMKDRQERFEHEVSIPLGDAEPPKNTIVTIRLNCTQSGSREYRYQF
ncbi:MAG: hypothetical protein AB8G05_16690 [Oligoflexales bacterium]